MKVTIHNYIFPINFTHKGWNVTLNKKMGFFKDVSVEAIFSPPTKESFVSMERDILRGLISSTGKIRISQSDYNKYIQISNQYLSTLNYPSQRTMRFSANGNMIDRFLGQNISATQKVVDQVESYMNSNLPTLAEFDSAKYVNYMIKNGVSSAIITSLAMLHGLTPIR